MLKGRIAIVTGGTKGIGKGIADALAKDHAKVVVCSRHKEKTKHYFIKCDASNFRETQNLVRETIKKFKKIDILVNNAGIYPFKNLLEMSEADWDKLIAIDLKSVFNCTKAVLPFMAKQKYGKIVNITSIAGHEVGFPGLTHYCAAKAGIVGFTKAAALELAQYKINVNAVAPGVILTPGVKEGTSKEQIDTLIRTIPEKRAGKPADIAATVVFLTSDLSEYITGQTIVVDGGFTNQ
ncbi:MAG: SDR family oxidoreductase [Nanoarchaeota archaeon]|nr:SDR family oxidoreductase [Nanoarchaeota archaeon]MBU1051215.1 SDR family oxidoreductase [Nanoarchaeota archaeon]